MYHIVVDYHDNKSGLFWRRYDFYKADKDGNKGSWLGASIEKTIRTSKGNKVYWELITTSNLFPDD
jgi:hypothetical protein